METSTTQQSGPMAAEPQKEHEWLRKLVGEWTHETAAPAAAGQTPETLRGTETVRSIGDLWFVAEGRGEMPGGGQATTLMTLGYDPQKKRFVGTWIGSMMTYLWVYDGELDATARVLTLSCVGPDFEAEGRTRQYRDVIEFKDDDHRVLTARMLGDDGEWQELMTASYRRNK